MIFEINHATNSITRNVVLDAIEKSILIKRVPATVCHPMPLSWDHQAYSDRTHLLCITSPAALYFRPKCKIDIILNIFWIGKYYKTLCMRMKQCLILPDV